MYVGKNICRSLQILVSASLLACVSVEIPIFIYYSDERTYIAICWFRIFVLLIDVEKQISSSLKQTQVFQKTLSSQVVGKNVKMGAQIR